jgi:hypothetical protein
MKALLALLLVVAGWSSPAWGKAKGGKRAPTARSAPAEARADTRADPRTEEAPAAATPATDGKPASGKAPKAKVYSFSGLDVEGKLKTPQLLYFLNRVKLELDTTSPEKRSFLKELEKTSDDKGL